MHEISAIVNLSFLVYLYDISKYVHKLFAVKTFESNALLETFENSDNASLWKGTALNFRKSRLALADKNSYCSYEEYLASLRRKHRKTCKNLGEV